MRLIHLIVLLSVLTLIFWSYTLFSYQLGNFSFNSTGPSVSTPALKVLALLGCGMCFTEIMLDFIVQMLNEDICISLERQFSSFTASLSTHENLRLCCHCICITAHNNEFWLYCLKNFFFWFHLCQVMAVKDLCSFSIYYEVQKIFRLLARLQGRGLTSFIPVASLQLVTTSIARWKKQHGLDCRLSGFFCCS